MRVLVIPEGIESFRSLHKCIRVSESIDKRDVRPTKVAFGDYSTILLRGSFRVKRAKIRGTSEGEAQRRKQ